MDTDIDAEGKTFVAATCAEDLDRIITKENLRPDETREFMAALCYRGRPSADPAPPVPWSSGAESSSGSRKLSSSDNGGRSALQTLS